MTVGVTYFQTNNNYVFINFGLIIIESLFTASICLIPSNLVTKLPFFPIPDRLQMGSCTSISTTQPSLYSPLTYIPPSAYYETIEQAQVAEVFNIIRGVILHRESNVEGSGKKVEEITMNSIDSNVLVIKGSGQNQKYGNTYELRMLKTQLQKVQQPINYKQLFRQYSGRIEIYVQMDIMTNNSGGRGTIIYEGGMKNGERWGIGVEYRKQSNKVRLMNHNARARMNIQKSNQQQSPIMTQVMKPPIHYYGEFRDDAYYGNGTYIHYPSNAQSDQQYQQQQYSSTIQQRIKYYHTEQAKQNQTDSRIKLQVKALLAPLLQKEHKEQMEQMEHQILEGNRNEEISQKQTLNEKKCLIAKNEDNYEQLFKDIYNIVDIPIPSKYESYVYSGQFFDGKKRGFGRLYSQKGQWKRVEGGKGTETNVGINSCYQYYYPSSPYPYTPIDYEGSWLNDRFHGYGAINIDADDIKTYLEDQGGEEIRVEAEWDNGGVRDSKGVKRNNSNINIKQLGNTEQSSINHAKPTIRPYPAASHPVYTVARPFIIYAGQFSYGNPNGYGKYAMYYSNCKHVGRSQTDHNSNNSKVFNDINQMTVNNSISHHQVAPLQCLLTPFRVYMGQFELGYYNGEGKLIIYKNRLNTAISGFIESSHASGEKNMEEQQLLLANGKNNDNNMIVMMGEFSKGMKVGCQEKGVM